MYEKNIKILWDSPKDTLTLLWTMGLRRCRTLNTHFTKRERYTLHSIHANWRCGSSSHLNNICRNKNKSFVPIYVCLVILINEKGEKLIVRSGLNNNDLFLWIESQGECIEYLHIYSGKVTYWKSNSKRNPSTYVQCGIVYECTMYTILRILTFSGPRITAKGVKS